MFPETFWVIWRNGQIFQNREALNVLHSHSITWDWCAKFPMMQWICCSYLYSDWFSKYLWENAGTKKHMYKKDRNKTVSERTTRQRSGYLWNISVVVCNLAGLDKNWTDFKKKKRTASKASATGMILVHSGFSVSSWCSGSTRQSQKLRIFSPVEVRLCMGMADKIEVVTIAIDE